MSRLFKASRKLIADENGATVVEYGVMVALIVAACIAIIIILGGQIQSGFRMFSEALESVGVSAPGGGS